MKLYSLNNKFVSVIGHSKTGYSGTFKIVWNIDAGLGHPIGKPSNLGSPIPTSKDYKKTEGRGRPKKHDYREVDKLIWKVILKSYHTKHGYDTHRVLEYVNQLSKKAYNKTLIFDRLNDMELRGLVTKHAYRSGNTWKWFWRMPNVVNLPHTFFQFPIREQFKDRELFPIP